MIATRPRKTIGFGPGVRGRPLLKCYKSLVGPYVESQQTVHRAGHSFGRCTPTDTQYPRDAGREETLPGPDLVRGAALCGLDALPYPRGVRPILRRPPRARAFPPYNFRAFEHTAKAEPEDQGGVS